MWNKRIILLECRSTDGPAFQITESKLKLGQIRMNEIRTEQIFKTIEILL